MDGGRLIILYMSTTIVKNSSGLLEVTIPQTPAVQTYTLSNLNFQIVVITKQIADLQAQLSVLQAYQTSATSLGVISGNPFDSSSSTTASTTGV